MSDWDAFPTVGKPAASEWDTFPAASAPAAPKELPDIGAPALGWGQQQFSPGVPAVNQAADVLARSANKNIIEPITHPVETLTGLGQFGAGLAQYAGAPGEGYKPAVDAVVQDYANTYGTKEGFKKALTEDPVRVAMDATMGWGALRGLGRRAGVVQRPPARVEPPAVAELFDAADTHYANLHGYGVELYPRVMADTATNITTELHSRGYRDYIAPKTFRALDELRNPIGQYTTTQDVEGVRRLLNKVAGDPAEADAARRAIKGIDDAMAGLKPADAAINPHFVGDIVGEAKAARGNYAAAMQAQKVEAATSRAELQAAATGSGANIDNATRQQIKNILNSPKKRRGFTPSELAEMEQVVRGTFTGNAARWIGKLAPTGVVSAALSGGLGHTIGHGVAVPVLGAVAKKIGDAATARAAERVSERVRLRSPAARRIGATPAPSRAPSVMRKLVVGSQAGRMANEDGNPFGETK